MTPIMSTVLVLSGYSIVNGASLSDASFAWTNTTLIGLRNHFEWDGATLPNPFARLPSSAKSRVASVYGLSKDSAGVQVAFVTNASSIALRWKMFESGGAAEGTVPIALHSGADLYVFDDNSRKWRWAGSATNITLDAGIIGKTIYHQLPMYTPSRAPMDRAYLLNLPMYGSLEASTLACP